MPASVADGLVYVIFLHQVPGRATTREAIHAHVAHLRRLDQAGKLVLCGPLTDAPLGLVVIRAADKAAAEATAQADPFVVQGVRTYTVTPWELAHAGNNYLDAP